MDIECVANSNSQLGEGCCWDPVAGKLWWVDIQGHLIHRFDPGTGGNESFETPGAPGSLAVRAAGGLVVAMDDGFSLFDPETRRFESICSPELHVAGTRMNDGRTDRQGRFWAGSIHEAPGDAPKPVGGLYRLDSDRQCTKMADAIGISNGLAWSPDGRTMYHTDSVTPYVWIWDYDPIAGEIENRRVFVDLSDIGAVADGATIDAAGCYWVALPFMGLVHRYNPNGELIQAIRMPVDAPTCCEFGGPNLDKLYVTSATFGRSADALKDQPLAGGLFMLDVGVTGLAATPFSG